MGEGWGEGEKALVFSNFRAFVVGLITFGSSSFGFEQGKTARKVLAANAYGQLPQ
jgi:hypothetical protein